MSFSLLKPTGLTRNIKWILIPHEPSNSSLVSAALPDDVLFAIIRQAAAQDTTTALALAMCSKAVGRAAETVLYASVSLRSIPAIRTFTSTLRTKGRHILACVTALRLGIATPPLFDDFWALVSERCPEIDTLSIWEADLEALLRPEMRIRPRQLSLLSNTALAGVRVQEPVDDAALLSRLTHLYIADSRRFFGTGVSRIFGSLRVRPEALLHVTHFASFLTLRPDLHWDEVRKIPNLRVCVFLDAFWALHPGSLPVDRLDRIVVLDSRAADDAEGCWKLAEEKIAGKRLGIS
ncbi:hypothetical protein HMN09_01140400 [Mycena chlorophos]|uniref:Uncharacterized protein n=1 Tax=Mycena chlorophos TaxID=658473 RepID=A0A8H6S8F5_MYCCL|nr:hypothetical protein HMN09_01140400 [Mycena chlorophos]